MRREESSQPSKDDNEYHVDDVDDDNDDDNGDDNDDDNDDNNDDDNGDDNDGKLVHTEGLGRLPLMMAAPSGGQ